VTIATPAGYRALDEAGVPAFLADLPALCARLGGEPAAWTVREVGDGNLNLVFIVEGPAGDLCVKQSLPYVRMVGESWPLPLDRALFEHRALVVHNRHAPGLVPAIFHHDRALYLTVMERLSPHVIMRRGMIEGIVYPRFAGQITEFMARTLFLTSDLAMGAEEKRRAVAAFSTNTTLCKITEDLIFTDPYMVHERNRWTSPELDDDARRIREDEPLKQAIAWLKWRFLTAAEALLHGDLHTGSIMVTGADTRVIDPEFAFYGPIGFDVGKLLGNLLLAYFSQDGHEPAPGARDSYRGWILDTTEAVWTGFAARFLELWSDAAKGDAFPVALLPPGGSALREVQERFLRQLFEESLGFAGAAMIRRTLGLAHNIDFELIEDTGLRASCERRNLILARDLMVHAADYPEITAVTRAARRVRAGEPPR
jgi:5-methylthioribose kinase